MNSNNLVLSVLNDLRNNYQGIGAFNFSTAEVLRGIVEEVVEEKYPVIVATSEHEANFLTLQVAAAMVDSWRKEFNWPIFLNLDHGHSLEIIKKAVLSGYDMVHFDGSTLSFEENIQKTKEVVDWVRGFEEREKKKIVVEGELGYLRGSSNIHREKMEISEEDLTKPEEAKEFIDRTGIDSLAIAIGNIHGIFIHSQQRLHLDRLREIKKIIGNQAFLVLHGGSGTPTEDLAGAVKDGITKFNFNTELRLAWSKITRQNFRDNPQEIVPYRLLLPVVEAIKKVVQEKVKILKGEYL